MTDYTPTPIEPRKWLQSSNGVDPVFQEIRDLTARQRVQLAIVMGCVAVVFFWGAYAITRLHHWVALAFAVLLLEPLGVLAALAAAYCLSPSGVVGRWFEVAVRRAKIVLLVFGCASALGTAIIVTWLSWELLKNG